MILIREHIDFQRGLDPKKAMSIGFFRFDVEYSGGFEENFQEDELFAREWIYNGERILETEGSAGSDHISMWIKLSDGKEFSVEANFTREKSAYLTIPAEDIKDKNVTKEFFEFFYNDSNPNYSPLNPVLAIYELYFKEIEDEKEMQRSWEEANEEELDESLDFERGIDPKASMRVGIPKWETLQEGDLVYAPKNVPLNNNNVIQSWSPVSDLPAGAILKVDELDNASTKEWTLWYQYFANMEDYKENKNDHIKERIGYITGTPKQFKEIFKLLSRGMNEAQEFQRGEDPKSSMSIGKTVLIENWLKEYDLFEDAIINKDLTIDIPASSNLAVDLNKKGLEELPEFIQFRKVYGGFNISQNKLKSLRGCPTHVFETENLKGSFKCFDNNLSSLEGGPKKIDGVYICYGNPGKFQRKDVNAVCKVKSKQIWGDDRMKINEGMDFQRTEDPMGTMDIGFHAQVKNWFRLCGISNDPLENDKYLDYRINKDGTIDVLEDANFVGAHIENFPYFIRFNRIYGSFYVANNNFTDLQGFPKEVDGDLSIYSEVKGAKKWKESDIRKKIKIKGTVWN
jgi:hypothetical protein